MKKIEDFKIINDTAELVGIAYREEAVIVDDFLRNNPTVTNVSLKTSDNRNFELVNGKLVFTKNNTFINPYFQYNNENKNVMNKLEVMEDKSIKLEPNSSYDKDINSYINDIKEEIILYSNKVKSKLDTLQSLIKDKR